MKTAREILNEMYQEIGGYNVSDVHRIKAMQEYGRQIAGAVRQECFEEWGDKSMQDTDTIDIEQFIN